MKAERRHELQQNTLARFIDNVPLYFRFHLNKILTGLLVILVIVFLIRYRMSSAQQSRQAADASLRAAREYIDQLAVRTFVTQDVATQRRSFAGQAGSAIEAVLRDTDEQDDAQVRAEAMVARGDLNWTLANLPALPGATTQPALELPVNPSEALDRAAQAYREVIQRYPSQTISAVTAMFGLAAIAENRGNWDAARAEYQAILQKPDVSQAFKTTAAFRLEMLERIRQPLFTGTLTTQPASEPATAPTTTPAS